MAKLSELYPSNSEFLSAKDLGDQEILVTLDGLTVETLQDKQKLVGTFKEISRKVVINKTNANVIADKYGEDFETWADKSVQVILYSAPTSYEGKQGIHFRLPKDVSAPPSGL